MSIEREEKETNRFLPLLNAENIERYTRQIIVDGVGLTGQQKLLSARVLVVGCGGLGSPVLLYLAAAGVGCIGVSDGDTVEISNLNRQTLFKEKEVGCRKTDIAQKCIEEMNSDTKVIIHPKIDRNNVWDVCGKYDIVVDCADSRSLRYLLNDCTNIKGIPFLCGSSLRWDGAVYAMKDICYRCIHPKIPTAPADTCASAGIIGGVCGAVGSILAVETVKCILGLEKSYMIHFNMLREEWLKVSLTGRKTLCNICKCKGSKSVAELIAEAGISSSTSTNTNSPNIISPNTNSQEKILTQASQNQSKIEVKEKVSGAYTVEWKDVLENASDYLLVDIRSKEEQKKHSVQNSYSHPVACIIDKLGESIQKIKKKAEKRKIAIFCRTGNVSLKFAPLLSGLSIQGGAHAYFQSYN